MPIENTDMGWYLAEHTRIMGAALAEVHADPAMKALLLRPITAPGAEMPEPLPWEDWLRHENQETFATLRRLRFRANELWASGSADPDLRHQFTTAVETEYQLAQWAAREYLKFMEKARALKNVRITELWNAGNTRYE